MADVIIADGKLTPRASISQVTLDWACGTGNRTWLVFLA